MFPNTNIHTHTHTHTHNSNLGPVQVLIHKTTSFRHTLAGDILPTINSPGPTARAQPLFKNKREGERKIEIMASSRDKNLEVQAAKKVGK